MNPSLHIFIDMLEENDLLEFDVIGDTDEHFENRLKLQKYVFLARYFGLDMGYNYSMYLYGPYSPGLAEDYFGLADDGLEYHKTPLPDEFNYKEFRNVLYDRDSGWLEIASTLLALRESFSDREALLHRAINMKGHRFEIDRIQLILAELEKNKLAQF